MLLTCNWQSMSVFLPHLCHVRVFSEYTCTTTMELICFLISTPQTFNQTFPTCIHVWVSKIRCRFCDISLKCLSLRIKIQCTYSGNYCNFISYAATWWNLFRYEMISSWLMIEVQFLVTLYIHIEPNLALSGEIGHAVTIKVKKVTGTSLSYMYV